MNLRWNQIAVSLLIGLLLGTFIGASRLRHHFFYSSKDKAAIHSRLLKKFTKRLELSPPQQQQVAIILEQTRTKLDGLFAETKPRLEAVRKEASENIKNILTPEQQKKFEVLDAEMEARFHRRSYFRH